MNKEQCESDPTISEQSTEEQSGFDVMEWILRVWCYGMNIKGLMLWDEY